VLAAQDSMLGLFKESASRSYFVLHQSSSADTAEDRVDFCRLDEMGGELSSKSLELKETGHGLLRRSVHPVRAFFDRVFGEPLQGGQRTLLLRRTGERPLEILEGTTYARWQTILSRTLLERSPRNSE